MNLAATVAIYGGGPGSGCNPAVAEPGCGRPRTSKALGFLPRPTAMLPPKSEKKNGWITMPHKSAPHVPDVVKQKRDWRRKVFKTKPGGYFRAGTFTAKLHQELSAHPNEWKSISELMKKHGAASAHGAIFALRDVGKNTGKWTIERHGDLIRLVPTEKGAAQGPAKTPDFIDDAGIAKKAAEAEQRLAQTPITETKGLEGGINDTKIAKFSDGTKAIFKVNARDRDQDSNELAAWDMAKVVGMTDLVPATIKREVSNPNGVGSKTGLMIEFQKGKVAKKLGSGYGNNEPEIYDGDRDLARSAAWDYVVANSDRHAGNWLVDGNQLHLIDHGYAFGVNPRFVRPGFLAEVLYRTTNGNGTLPSPKALAEPYVNKLPQLKIVMKRNGLSDTTINQTEQRIKVLAGTDNWNDLRNKHNAV